MTPDDIVSALEGLRALVRDPVTKSYALLLPDIQPVTPSEELLNIGLTGCADCQALRAFFATPEKTEIHFPETPALKEHLEQVHFDIDPAKRMGVLLQTVWKGGKWCVRVRIFALCFRFCVR